MPIVVEAILEPSKTIRKGYETVTVVTKDGKTLTGRLLEERPEAIVLRESAPQGKSITIARADIDERRDKGPSLMPEGLVNQLGSRQQFLDLVRYLMEIADRGPARALELRPDFRRRSALHHCPAMRLISTMPGSSPIWVPAASSAAVRSMSGSARTVTAPRIAPARCPRRSDSRRVCSRMGLILIGCIRRSRCGFGQMPPQTWMVPVQKYDVIHYIREEYLKGTNPTQYSRIDRGYLDQLPKGRTRGPAPAAIDPWIAMDYGPSLMATVEAGDDGSNIAYKGIAVRLDPGPGGVSRGRAWSLFEHDTLRLAAWWTGEGFIDWEGINFNGKHQVHPRVVGLIRVANPSGPGWGNPETGSFDDPRPRGRDGRPYGPLPRSWGHYRGLYRNGGKTILSYTVGTTAVLETPGLEDFGAKPIFTRSFEIGPRERDLVLQVAQLPGAPPSLRNVKTDASGEAVLFGAGTDSGPDAAPTGAANSVRTGNGVDASGSRGVRAMQRQIMTSSTAAIVAAGVSSPSGGFKWRTAEHGNLRLTVPKGPEAIRFTLWICGASTEAEVLSAANSIKRGEPATGAFHTDPRRCALWGAVLSTQARAGRDDGPFAVDVLTQPESNPWLCQMRSTGLDFLPGGNKAVLCTWDGDVWEVQGIEDRSGKLSWRRIASGLFQPLGIKVVRRADLCRLPRSDRDSARLQRRR